MAPDESAGDANHGDQWERPVVSGRDHENTRLRLETWLAGHLGADASPTIAAIETPASNGMSSDTLLFEATWMESGVSRSESLVARVAPEESAVPVFPVYDLACQARVMQLVAQVTNVPVPHVYWVETDPSFIGAEFFVMGRVNGDVPPDVMPYTFGDTWVTEGSTEDRARLERSTVDVLAMLHGIEESSERFGFLASPGSSDQSALRRHFNAQRTYMEWVMDGREAPLLERAFEWLEERWPVDEGSEVVSWGDARIGNVMYRDFEPVAVFDWEMATLAPREVDLGWMIFLHRFFQDLAEDLGAPGIPDFMQRHSVVATYEELSGYTPRDMDWFTTYAALRHGVILTRVGFRSAAFGQGEIPADIDDLVMHRRSLEAMLMGTYWDGVEGA